MKIKKTIININLLVIAALLSFWIFRIWQPPVELHEAAPGKKERPVDYHRLPVKPVSFYNLVAENDIFSPARRNPAGRIVSKNSSPAAIQRAPSITLLGTVLAGGSKIAIIDPRKPDQRPASYRIDDDIDGYTLIDIFKNKIILEKAGTTFEVVLNKNGAPGFRESRRISLKGSPANIKSRSFTNQEAQQQRTVPAPPPPPPPRPVHQIGLNSVK